MKTITLEEILAESKSIYEEIIANAEQWEPDESFMAAIWKELAVGNPNGPQQLAGILSQDLFPDAILQKARDLNANTKDLSLDDYRKFVITTSTTFNPGFKLHEILLRKIKQHTLQNLGLQ